MKNIIKTLLVLFGVSFGLYIMMNLWTYVNTTPYDIIVYNENGKEVLNKKDVDVISYDDNEVTYFDKNKTKHHISTGNGTLVMNEVK